MSANRPGGATAMGEQPVAPARRKKKTGEGAHDNEERWLLTYADMITLLLVLFVVLYAMSTPSTPKFLAFRAGLTAAFNPSAIATSGSNGLMSQSTLESQLNNNQSISPLANNVKLANANFTKLVNDRMTNLATSLQRALIAKHLQSYASVTQTTRGVVVQIMADKVFFASGEATLGTLGNEIVDTISGLIAGYPNNIEVEGYADNQPILGGPFSSNWELSGVRAANVVNRFNSVDHIKASRLASVGFGANDPVASNATPQGRQQNRRIDVVILGK